MAVLITHTEYDFFGPKIGFDIFRLEDGSGSIEAVVNPAPNPPAGGVLCVGVPRNECEYLYYVLADEDGRHAFAVTYDQHLANVEKALQAGLL